MSLVARVKRKNFVITVADTRCSSPDLKRAKEVSPLNDLLGAVHIHGSPEAHAIAYPAETKEREATTHDVDETHSLTEDVQCDSPHSEKHIVETYESEHESLDESLQEATGNDSSESDALIQEHDDEPAADLNHESPSAHEDEHDDEANTHDPTVHETKDAIEETFVDESDEAKTTEESEDVIAVAQGAAESYQSENAFESTSEEGHEDEPPCDAHVLASIPENGGTDMQMSVLLSDDDSDDYTDSYSDASGALSPLSPTVKRKLTYDTSSPYSIHTEDTQPSRATRRVYRDILSATYSSEPITKRSSRCTWRLIVVSSVILASGASLAYATHQWHMLTSQL
jgi:hypothetical protein